MATSHVACEFLGSGKICDIIKMTRECMRQMGGGESAACVDLWKTL